MSALPTSGGALPALRRWHAAPYLVTALVIAGVSVPLYAGMTGDSYLVAIMSRILVYALAAVGLNLCLGFGGMISMGHAMYLGLGAYIVPVAADLGVTNGWLQLLLLVLAVGPIAGVVGAISLRTRGIAFIMITLAFAQMFFFLCVSFKRYGGDEGISLQQLSDFGVQGSGKTGLYYALLATLIVVIAASDRLKRSRFGLVLQAARINERRVGALGTNPLPYQLLAYVLSALVCAIAGFFLANLTGFVSPASLAWTVSGELIVMVVLGGLGTVMGPLVGALSFLLVEEGLKALTEHWLVILGPLIVLMALLLRRGLWGLVAGREGGDAR
ncbi:branched-chain amino acid ABC transporter permease [Variovorax paradoxus]|uniref:branched-chain amino acid ABC transporter permease n=1 Tax=Variovorax paradoxus TaxID=34073 RepID=UPI002783971A|nr:branched-chain amino acid ABC transporter permease [Variovorax paradoxus]MDP9932793.1 branched-chain amino acid transport system permease protein [Variovorax paradoxus]